MGKDFIEIALFVIPAKAGIQISKWIPHQVRNDKKRVIIYIDQK
ncbi:MAG: hypothetical protein AAGD17_10930 [Bacteroidota bacterium]